MVRYLRGEYNVKFPTCPGFTPYTPIHDEEEDDDDDAEDEEDSSGVGHAYSLGPTVAVLAEMFQKFLPTQPHAMSASSNIGLPSSSSSVISSSIWILDSGASHHMSSNFTSFVSLHPASSVSVMTADDTPMPLAGIGSDPQSKRLIGTGRRQGGLYILDELRVPDIAASSVDLSSFRLSSSSSKFYLWHSRLGHVSSSRLKYLVSTGALGELKTSDISDCCDCKLAKFSALPFPKSVSLSVAPFDLVHSDVWGPSPVVTKVCFVHLSKLNIMLLLNVFDVTWEVNIPLLNSLNYLHVMGLSFKLLVLTLLNKRELLKGNIVTLLKQLVPFFCDRKGALEAILTAAYIINRIPSSVTSGLSPFQKLYGHAPDYSALTCFVLLPHVQRNKLSSRSAICVFIGYGDGQKGYCCYDPDTQKLFVSRHVVFFEHIPYYSIPPSSHSFTKSDPIPIDPFHTDTDIEPHHVIHHPNHLDIELVSSSSSKAMAEELYALQKTDTWDLISLPPGKRAIGSRWVYKIKTKSDGFVERYKARLVAKGLSQQYGLDYEETFALVAKMTNIRSLIAVASIHHFQHGIITLSYISSSMQLADVFTKSHSTQHFCFLISKLSMILLDAS
ncbi:uncharacterized protein LOC110036103 [Phalaenopsis equestris]|uniref:uncharacterized protein LOC110036103 n=1 Tax=Phalaenopsis equestris TaxID=78828 RepID=UPI0009E2A9E4|nr:uncharacterized protein LOC110036103 [Phalaenopsis equestris]